MSYQRRKNSRIICDQLLHTQKWTGWDRQMSSLVYFSSKMQMKELLTDSAINKWANIFLALNKAIDITG